MTINTIGPKKLQSIYALDFQNFGLESFRLPIAGLSKGRRIFTTDGPFWKHWRALVESIFTRAQFADLEMLEHHLKQMMDLSPGTESSVELPPPAFNSSTDFDYLGREAFGNHLSCLHMV